MDSIHIDKRGNVTIVTLNRPERMNAITMDMHHALQAAFDAFGADDGQHACIVTGTGEKAFCAGTDLRALSETGTGAGLSAYPKNGYAGIAERYDLDKPIIAAVNGLALGGGFEVALSCDLIIASENATFGLPEPLVGAVALGGGLHRLARQIGVKQAMGFVLTGKKFDAQEAYRLGLVNELVKSPSDVVTAALRWCEAIAKCAPPAVRASKQTLIRGLDEPSLQAAMTNQETYPAFKAWRSSEDLVEGPRAFSEKRPPAWKGR